MPSESIKQLISQRSLVTEELTKYLTNLKKQCGELPSKVLQRLYNNSSNQTYEKLCQPIDLVHIKYSALMDEKKQNSLNINKEPQKSDINIETKRLDINKEISILKQVKVTNWTLQKTLGSLRAIIFGPSSL